MFAPPQAAHSARSRPRRMFPVAEKRPSPRSFRRVSLLLRRAFFCLPPPAFFGKPPRLCGQNIFAPEALCNPPPPAFLGEPPCHFASKKSAPEAPTPRPRQPVQRAKKFLRLEAPTPRPRCGCVFLQTEKQRLRMPMQRRCFDRGTDGLVPAVADKSETTRKERLFRIPPFTIRFGFSSCTSGKSRRRSEGRRLSFFGFQCFSDIPKSFSRLNRNLRFLTFCDIPSVKLSVHENFLFFYRIATPSCFEDSLFPLP